LLYKITQQQPIKILWQEQEKHVLNLTSKSNPSTTSTCQPHATKPKTAHVDCRYRGAICKRRPLASTSLSIIRRGR